jgi:hypothetical protein
MIVINYQFIIIKSSCLVPGYQLFHILKNQKLSFNIKYAYRAIIQNILFLKLFQSSRKHAQVLLSKVVISINFI